MLQIPNHFLLNEDKGFHHFVNEYLSDNTYHHLIPSSKQLEKLKQLEESIANEYFYFTIDIKSNTIINCNGVSRWLGYSDNQFTIRNFHQIIHPAHALLQGLFATEIFGSILNNHINPQYLVPISATMISLKHSNGHYLYCKQICSPFQLSLEGKMTEYLAVFSIIKSFNNEDFNMRFLEKNDKLHILEKAIGLSIKDRFERDGSFSVQEFKILKKYANQENITSNMIAKILQLEKTTIDTYNKRILKKSEEIFQQKFDNAKKVADFLKRVGLI